MSDEEAAKDQAFQKLERQVLDELQAYANQVIELINERGKFLESLEGWDSEPYEAELLSYHEWKLQPRSGPEGIPPIWDEPEDVG